MFSEPPSHGRIQKHVKLSHENEVSEPSEFAKAFAHGASGVAHAAGKPLTFALSVMVILVWAISGPVFHFSDTWQLVINTGTTIITFLMVFLIQTTQNRDGAAIQAKLDELVRSSNAANRYVGIEELTEEELEDLRQTCRLRAKGVDRNNTASSTKLAPD